MTTSTTFAPVQPDWGWSGLKACEAAGLLHRDARLADVIARCRGSLVYLATPYSRLVVIDGRFDAMASHGCGIIAARWSRLLAVEGVTAISPILQAVEMVHADLVDGDLDPLDAAFWERWCRPLLVACGAIIVPPVLGWDDSAGIWHECGMAMSFNRPVYLLAGGQYAPREVEP